jgi:hypothetical protein
VVVEHVLPLRRLAIFGLGRSTAQKEANSSPLRSLAVIFVSKWLCCMCVFRAVPASSTEVVRVSCSSSNAITPLLMPVPAVSPENWQRTTIICSFVMGTSLEMATGLSFQDQLATIIENKDSYRERAMEIEEDNKDSREYHYHADFDASPDNPHQIRLSITQVEPHRPNVDSKTVQELQEAVKDEKPTVPTEKFDFDTNLGIVLDQAERYYNALQCEIARNQTPSRDGNSGDLEQLNDLNDLVGSRK